MYKVRNKVYADAGHILVGNGKIGYSFLGEVNEFSEEEVFIDDMHIEGGFIVYSNGRIIESFNLKETYESRKAKYVKRLFSNDDQIAIILNKDRSVEDQMLFDKMQEWREWCGVVAKKVSNMQQ